MAVADLLDELLKLSRVAIAVERDPARYRVSDLPILVGDASRLRARLGWRRAGPCRRPCSMCSKTAAPGSGRQPGLTRLGDFPCDVLC